MKKLSILLVFLSLGFTLLGQQEDMNSGIIYGKNFAYTLTAPKGWELDNQSGVSQGIYAVFYRKGGSWANSETVMYANAAPLKGNQKTVSQLIKNDEDNFKRNHPDIKITTGKDILIKNKVVARVRFFFGKSYGNYEAVAYIDAGTEGVMIVMTSRAKSGFENSLEAFKKLVQSYALISHHVIIEKNND